MTDDRIPPHDEEDPDERELSRRSSLPALGLWVTLGLVAMLGALAYVASALL